MSDRQGGSLLSLGINGISYDAFGDVDASIIPSSWENDMLPTSGKGMLKRTRRVEKVEGIPLALTALQREQIKLVADAGEDVALSFTLVTGESYQATGIVNIVDNKTAENRTEVVLLPRGKWTRLGA